MNGAALLSPEALRSVKQLTVLTNSARIWAVADELAMSAHFRSFDFALYSTLCIHLSRLLDYAIAYNEVPDRVSELPAVLKLACQRRNMCSLQAALMVLMVTVKNVCKAQWFSSIETQELLSLANEVASVFCTPQGFSCEQANIISSVMQIMPRYYPWFRLGHILASIAIKPGFEACAVDFHISKNINCAAMERISLLVAMKDNIDTSSCIINPPKVNFLLNGVGLQGRIVDCMNREPQLPTIVNRMLRYGTNLLQAIGHFDAHYIVLIGFMSVIPASELPPPPDYVQSQTTAVDSDAEIIKGPQKICLDCPISFTRITKPVKGYLCKHLQCFDLSNYIELNTKIPSWRCPLCNQPVGYSNIRIDQKMSKILQEADQGVTNVVIHSDSSWEATYCSDDYNVDALQPEQHGPSNVWDIAGVDVEMISLDVDAPHINQNSATQIRDIPCSDPLGNYSGPADYNTRENPEANHAHIFGPPPSLELIDSVSPDAYREHQDFLGTNQQYCPLTSIPPPSFNNLWPQQVLLRQMTSMGNVITPQNTCSPLPTVSTSAITAQMDSIQQQYILQSQLLQIFGAQMRGLRAPFQVNGNPYRATPGLEAPRQPQLANHIRGRTRASQIQALSRPLSTAGIINALADCADSSGTVQGVTRTEDVLNVQSEQNWHPTGRMRGSLSGRAYNEAHDQFVIRPTQTTPAPMGQPSNISPQLQVLLANRNIYSSQPEQQQQQLTGD